MDVPSATDPAAPPPRLPRALWFVLGGLLIYLLSPAGAARGFYLADWRAAADGWTGIGLVRWLALTAGLAGLLMWRRVRAWHLLALIVIGVIAAGFHRLGQATEWQALHRDDHPSMMYRLWLFRQTFPQAVNYSPWWNGGVMDSAPVSSGIPGLGLLLWPLWRSGPVHEVYTAGIGIAYLLGLPGLAAWAVRLAGGDRRAVLVGALLGLGVSRHFFLWALHFGTVGASLASAWVMPAAGALYRVLVLEKRDRGTFAALAVSIYFTVQWPPGALMLGLLGLGVLAYANRLRGRTLGLLAGAALLAGMLDVNHVRALLDKSSSPVRFALQQPAEKADAEPAAAAPAAAMPAKKTPSEAWSKLGAHVLEGHPVLIFFGVAGTLLAGGGGLRRFFGPALLGFVVLGSWGPDWLPNLQLERMIVPGLFAAVVPAALLAARVVQQETRVALLPQAALLALLLLGGHAVSHIYGNRTTAPYVTMGDQVRGVVERVAAREPAGGRVLFAGAMVHAMGRGHVAYLPVLTGAEMMACDYYHFPTRMVEYNYPPRAHRTNDAALAQFLDLYDVTHLITFRRDWKRYFDQRPDTFEKIDQVDDLVFYRVARAPARFLRGSGRVRAAVNRLEIDLDDAQAEAVVKYNWVPGLRADPPAELFPVETRPGIQLLGVRPGGTNRVVVTFEPGSGR